MRLLIVLALCALLAGCSVGKGYLFDTDSKCRVLTYGDGGSGTVSTPYMNITVQGPGSYHVIGDGCQGVPFHHKTTPEAPAS